MSAHLNLEVPFLNSIDQFSPINDISAALNHLPKSEIRYTPWPEFSYKPQCTFVIAHGGDCVFLKFFVAEDNVLARFTQPNDLVYKDSCVEFFIAFNGEEEYYNFEFNCIGTAYLAYGTANNRNVAEVEIIKNIKRYVLLYNDNGKVKWELTLVIPIAAFYKHDLSSLLLKKAKGNFYKCGDDLPVPHYVAWNNIECEEPNFHLPGFFGNINFGGL